MVQILHCGSYQHWIVASNINCPKDTVYVFNSFDEDIPNDTIEQIASILHSKAPQITLISRPYQTQEGASDCGLFAIACVESLLRGDDPSNLRLDQDLMRDHLLKSLENDHFTPFSSCVCPSSLCLSSVERILEVELYCDCRMPELKTNYFGFPTGDMIECTHCKEWFHDCCKKNPKKYFKIDSLDYFCSKICKVKSNKSMSLSY